MNNFRCLPFAVVLLLMSFADLSAQSQKGVVTGKVMDTAQASLVGARVELQPGGQSAVSNGQGEYTISGLDPGSYVVRISMEGFAVFSADAEITSEKPVRIDAILQIGTHNEVVTVTGERSTGEIEALTVERTADNIVQVLPADVITSLPNTNIADAVGRLPSVSLERDEGEGKYVQIRGTEPRLSNVTVDSIHLPSPEGTRVVKLDVIPADLVESVEINKTLSANQDADAIGGSVNLVTKSPGEKPYVTLLGMGGHTPIANGRNLYQLAGTAGERFGADKKFGALFGFSYDYNARGIYDVEPGPGVFTLPSGNTFVGPNTEDLRNYHYDRSRYGFGGTLDYKIGDMSSVYVRGLFSHFNDNGEDWIYTPSISNFITSVSDPNNTCGITSVSGVQGCGGMGFRDIYRTPTQQIVSVQTGARHVFGGMVLNYEAALSESSYTGGFAYVNFNGPGSSNNSVAFGVDTADPFVPKFPVLNGVNIYDPTQYAISWANKENDGIFERDIVGDVSLSKQYTVASHFSTFEVGFKGWDAHKTSVLDRENYNAAGGPGQTVSSYVTNFVDNNYYFGQYKYGPITQYTKIAAVLAPGGFSPNLTNNIPNDWDIGERIWAGYAMNTINLGKLRLQTGVRVESTGDNLRGNLYCPTIIPTTCPQTATPILRNVSYTNAFPSVQTQYRITNDTVLRAAYGMGIARPNFGSPYTPGLAPFVIYDPTGNPNTPVTAGNPDLKPTHAQNVDVLLAHYFRNVGNIEVGYFYKYLSDPIYNVTIPRPVAPYQGLNEFTAINGPKARINGIEMIWQQQLTFLPNTLKGIGVRANYSYTTSRADFPSNYGRTDHPTLLRTAPNNWNFDVTYDRKGISARMGLTHNDANIWSYGPSNAKNPNGDTYLYPHTQVDTQVSYWIPGGHGLQAVVSMLNLNNEVFGFYFGAEQYPIQREYYNRTYSLGLRWTLSAEKH